MKRTPLVLVVLVLVAGAAADGCSAANCNAIAESGDFGAFVVGTAKNLLNVTAAPFSGSLICPQTPAATAQALDPGSACAAEATDDPCVACMKASCCAPSLDCWEDGTCTCLVACRTVKCDASAAAEKCGEADDAFTAELGCLDDHCAEVCGGP